MEPTAEQVQVLKRRLLKKGSEINEELTNLMSGKRMRLAEGEIPVAKPGETPIERLKRFLNLVDRKIKSVAAGTYGRCDECREPLPFESLDELPWADTCRACASKLPP
jgi:RNA polymerase-binding transcription factor DksA